MWTSGVLNIIVVTNHLSPPPPLPPSLAAIINQLLQRAFIKYSEINFKQIFLGNFHVTYKAHTLAINQQFIDTKNSYFVLN